MNKHKLWYWTPRILGVIFTIFLTIFAFDVFTPGKSIWEVLKDFLIHLMPNYVLLVVLLIAWRKEILGGLLFIGIGLVFTLFYKTYELLPNFLLLSFPLFILGFLFMLHGFFLNKGIAN
jgi:hypothetical protein